MAANPVTKDLATLSKRSPHIDLESSFKFAPDIELLRSSYAPKLKTSSLFSHLKKPPQQHRQLRLKHHFVEPPAFAVRDDLNEDSEKNERY